MLGRSRPILGKVIKDDLTEELLFELRLDRWGGACHDRKKKTANGKTQRQKQAWHGGGH